MATDTALLPQRRTLIKSFIGVDKIKKSVVSFNNSIENTQKTTLKINQTLVQSNRQRQSTLVLSRSNFQKRREAVQRREREDIIEASGISGAVKRQGKVISSSTKGFLGRILDFAGTLMVGWMVNNLPKIINLGGQLIERIGKLVGVLRSFVSNLNTTLSGFGGILTGSVTNFINFDFSDDSRLISNSFDRLKIGMNGMTKDFDDAVNILKQPLDFGFGDIKAVPGAPPGSSDAAGDASRGEDASETSGGGKILNPQAGYSYLKQLGVDKPHALGILANIKGESGFRIDSKQSGGPGVGLFQYSSAGRKDNFLKAVPDYKTNWKGQIKYAINEDKGPEYLQKSFSSPEEAAEWWMLKWERPDSGVYAERRRKHNQFIKSFDPNKLQPAPVTPATGSRVVDTANISRGGNGTVALTANEGFGAPRDDNRDGKTDRLHAGIDINTNRQTGWLVGFRGSGTVIFAGVDGGYGNLVKIKSGNTTYYFAHLAKIYTKRGPYNGEVIGEIGNTGGNYGIHLHYEVRPNGVAIDPRPYLNLLDIGRKTSAAVTTTAKPAAQVASAKPATEVTKNITQERRGQTIVVPIPGQQVAQALSPSGGGSSGSSSIGTLYGNTVNRYANQRQSVELAYT